MALSLIHMEEGVVTKETGGYTYEYFLKDHLGNVRMVFKPGSTGPIVLQKTDYYPFGMAFSNQVNSSTNNRYLYNGKEIQSSLDLGWYDYGARFYDPVIARWTTPDPLEEKSMSWSPYNYVYDDPIGTIDPNGKEAIAYNGNSKKEIKKHLNDQFGQGNGFRFNFFGLGNKLVYKANKDKNSSKYSKEQKDMLGGLNEIISSDKKVYVAISKDENVNIKIEGTTASGIKTTWTQDQIDKGTNGQYEGGETVNAQLIGQDLGFAAVMINEKVASTEDFDAGNGQRTAPCESCATMHELLDHALYYVRNGTLDPPNSKDQVKYNNEALKVKGSKERTGSDHGH